MIKIINENFHDVFRKIVMLAFTGQASKPEKDMFFGLRRSNFLEKLDPFQSLHSRKEVTVTFLRVHQ